MYIQSIYSVATKRMFDKHRKSDKKAVKHSYPVADRPFRPNFDLRTLTKETGFFTKSAISMQYLRKKPGF
ncbi:hypothetical protein [Microcoleus sp. B13-B6]|uniref:hypothetical protein n=1 Tax=Microcoleus sp. B13-B6 TaxID=2818652 RepID=UPI002FCFD345